MLKLDLCAVKEGKLTFVIVTHVEQKSVRLLTFNFRKEVSQCIF